jgi:hypothetical protein
MVNRQPCRFASGMVSKKKLEGIMRKWLVLLVMSVCLGVTGCAGSISSLMVAAPDATLAVPSSEETHVVFLRATNFGGAVQAPVIEEVNGKLSFVAVVSANMKVLHKTTPGQHAYVVGGESSAMLEANLAGGKTYYVKVTPHFGLWKARFTLDPVTDQEVVAPEFKKDFDQCRWYENGPETQAWFAGNLPSLQDKYADALKKFQAETPENKSVLRQEYGVSDPWR